MENDITELLKKRVYLFLIGLLLIVFCASFILLHKMDASNAFTLSNARIVYEQSELQAGNTSVIQEFHISEGDHVTAGMLLVTVQSVFSDEELARLQKNVELAQRNVEQIRYGAAVASQNTPASSEGMDAARMRMERMNELYEMGAVSAAKRNEAAAAYEQEKNALTMGRGQMTVPNAAALKAAEEQLKKSEETLAKARDHAGTTGFFAVREGVVSKIHAKKGDLIDSGASILTLDLVENGWIEAEISAEDMNRIYPGQIVRYELSGRPAEATVEEITDSDTEPEDKKIVRISVPHDRITGHEENITLHFLP